MYPERTKESNVKKLIIVLVALFVVGGCFAAIAGSDVTEDTNEGPSTSQPAEEDVSEAPLVVPEHDTEPEPEEEPEPEPEPEMTSGQENALRAAEDYINYSAFSKKGLIEQLEFEGYDTGDATFAASHINVNWKEQAARAAEDYLAYSAFSRSGLIEQLMFEGYTRKQAEYGTTQAGL